MLLVYDIMVTRQTVVQVWWKQNDVSLLGTDASSRGEVKKPNRMKSPDKNLGCSEE